jgi:hypothetical protein
MRLHFYELSKNDIMLALYIVSSGPEKSPSAAKIVKN